MVVQPSAEPAVLIEVRMQEESALPTETIEKEIGVHNDSTKSRSSAPRDAHQKQKPVVKGV